MFLLLLFCCCVSLCLVAFGLWVLWSLGLFLILFGCFLGWPFESLGLFSFDLVFFWVLAFGFATAAFLSLLRLSLAGVFGVCTFPFGSVDFRLPLFVGCPTMTVSFACVHVKRLPAFGWSLVRFPSVLWFFACIWLVIQQ